MKFSLPKFCILFFLITTGLSCCDNEGAEETTTVKNVIVMVDMPPSCNTDNGNKSYQIKIEGFAESGIILTAGLPERF